MLARARPVRLAAMIGVLGLVVAGTAGDETQVLLALVATVPADVPPRRSRCRSASASRRSLSVTIFIIVWIGMGVAHAALLRGLDHGGALRVPGPARARSWATPAPTSAGGCSAAASSPRVISPNKTVEGLLCGIVVGTLVVWYSGSPYRDEDWISTASTACCSA